MIQNVGSLDRLARLILAAVLLVLWGTGAVSGPLGIVLVVVAVVFAATALFARCPLYLPFGLSTRGGSTR